MKFVTNTKPLSDALDLGVISSNVSNFHKKSTVVQVTATKSTLKINIESAFVCSEILLRGQGDEDTSVTVFVGSLILKQLVNTLDSAQVTLEFAENGLILHSGKSKFTLPKLVDADELELASPTIPDYDSKEIAIIKQDWKFIKDNQMFAIAMSFIHPVYTRVWLGASGDVIVGDFDSSLFTKSNKTNLGNTCLVSDTVVNLFNTVPDGTKLIQVDRAYLLKYECDSFSYTSQFNPLYEDDENVGSYNSEIFLDMMKHPDDYITVKASSLSKFLNQADMLSSATEDRISMSVDANGEISLHDNNVDCKVSGSVSGSVVPYSLDFKSESLRRIISNYDENDIAISSMEVDGEVSGILVWDNELTTVLAGVE